MAATGRSAGATGPCGPDRGAARAVVDRRPIQIQVHRATEDMVEQHRILNRAASLIDAGELRTTHTETLSPINAQQLREAHRRLESGSTIGKLVLAGW
ncbi:zinc-binding dehydrogenase [Xanthomonas citri]|uniref:zinc-binding dehydrogenase n=1 Tax=Xanthomonas citri TaxID=346 RepID=UPI001E2B5DC4|nr:zinc-binding dehydrogenase [Xanthomonas citri]MCC8567149.1 zinc-binding dehydrogenase [Xanthomonas citri pv. fuscans]